MVLHRALFRQRAGQVVSQDRFRTVELAIAFKKITCYRCGLVSVYKYTVQQVRRKPELLPVEGEEIRSDHLEMWKAVPRFAEIPETIKCKRCKEVVGLYTFCIY